MNLIKLFWIFLLALGCSSADVEVDDIELGTAEQPIVVENSPNTFLPILGAPRAALVGSWTGLSRCTVNDGSSNIGGCKGGFVMYTPVNRFIHYIVADNLLRQAFADACGAMLSSGSNRGCAAENGTYSCSVLDTCVTVTRGSVGTNFADFDFRNYYNLGCTSSGSGNTFTNTYKGNNYTVQRCFRYGALVDDSKMLSQWGASGHSTRQRMLAKNILLQTISVGGHTSNSDGTTSRWNFPSAPTADQPVFMTAGEVCRSNNTDASGTGVSFVETHACPNN